MHVYTLEQMMNRELLYFICRHHIHELLLRCAFKSKFGKTTGPETQLFKKFEVFWKTANHEKYDVGILDDFVSEALRDQKEEVLNLCLRLLKVTHIRNNYREFVEVVTFFL